MKKIVFRADGSAEIGLGHVIRSLALVEMLKEDFYCLFAVQNPSETLHQQIAAVCQEVIILPKTGIQDQEIKAFSAHLNGNEIVVLDGYQFDTDYQKKIKNKGCSLVCIDDIHAYHFVADMIINHGITDGLVYKKEAHTKMLLGTDYCLLREPFLHQLKNGFSSYEEHNIFLCFGGSDAGNLTCLYLERLLGMQGLAAIHVVIGSAFQHKDALQQLLLENKKADIKLYRNISAHDLLKVVYNCKVAIVPGSTIAIECASTGILMMCGYYVDNQRGIVQMLGDKGLAVTVGDFTLLKESVFVDTLQNLLKADGHSWYERSRLFFDGKAGERYIKAFRHLFLLHDIHIRKASETDVRLFYDWANDPVVRQSAINQQSIPFENHCTWFANKLVSPQSHLYVAVADGKDFGQVRFDLEEEGYTISYSVSSEMRGKGLAMPMLEASIEQLRKNVQQAFTLNALVKKDNTASVKVFENLHFAFNGNQQKDSTTYLVFRKRIEHELNFYTETIRTSTLVK